MSSKRYREEFKIEAVKQITEQRYLVTRVSVRLGLSQHSLYKGVKKYSEAKPVRCETQSQQAEFRGLKAELKRVTEERDILKKAAAYFARITVRYTFIRTHETQHSLL